MIIALVLAAPLIWLTLRCQSIWWRGAGSVALLAIGLVTGALWGLNRDQQQADFYCTASAVNADWQKAACQGYLDWQDYLSHGISPYDH